MYCVNTPVSLPSFYTCYMFRLLKKPSSGCKTFFLEDVTHGSAIMLGSQTITFDISIYLRSGRDSSVSITTRYGLDGPGMESR